MSFLLLATVLSTQIPETAIDHTWGKLMRAHHHTGAWSVEVGKHRLAGDWIIVESDRIHLVDTKSASYCEVLPVAHRMHCKGAANELYNLYLPEGVELTAGTHAIDRYDCKAGSCTRGRVGRLTSDTRRKAPTLLDARRLFERLHGRTIESVLGATRTMGSGMTMLMRYRIENPAPLVDRRFSREVIEVEATVRLTTNPKPTIAPREVARYSEDCEYSARAASSCHPQPPTCTRR